MLWKRLTFRKQDPGPSRRFPFLDRRHLILIARRRHNFRFTSRAQLRARMRVRTYTYGPGNIISPRATVKAKPGQKISDETSIKIIKNEVGCRDDTVPKTVDTRRHWEEE